MVAFFVPFADSPEQAERVYQGFVKNSTYPIAKDHPRLRSITFRFHGRLLDATVGQEISGFPERAGEVLAIVETTQLVSIHTVVRGGLSASPILSSPDEVVDRLYFDAPPAHA